MKLLLSIISYYHSCAKRRLINLDTSYLHPTPVDGQVMLKIFLLLLHDPLTPFWIIIEAKAPSLLSVAEAET